MQPSIENIESTSPRRKPRAISSFLKKTFELLNEPENSVCIRWAFNGIGFIVTDQELFSKTVLPKYFKHSNYSSFVRQLNMYNFHKIRETNSESYFHHQCFDRDNKNAMAEIKRKPQKKKRKNEESDFERSSNESISIRPRKGKATSQRNVQQIKDLEIGGVSITLIREQNDEPARQEKFTKGNVISQTTNHSSNQQNKMSEEFKSDEPNNVQSSNNILSIEDDDKLSINEEITQKIVIPRFNTKELFYPSTNNLYPMMGSIQPSTFSLFF